LFGYPFDQIDNEIERWLERIVLAMGVDRSSVVTVVPESGPIYISHQWARKGVSAPHRGGRLDEPSDTPWLDEKARSGEVVVISRMDDLPPEAATDRETFRKLGNKSKVTIPLKVGGVVVGALLFGTFSSRDIGLSKECSA